MKLTLVITAILLTYSMPAWSQYRASQAQANAVDAQLTAGAFAKAAEVALDDCTTHHVEAFNTSNRLAERERQAAMHGECVKFWRGYIAARTPGAASAIRDLFEPATAESERLFKKASSENQFMGMNFGVGLGVSVAGSEAIDDAEVVGGRVTVKSSRKQQPRVFLEYHSYIEGWCYNAQTAKTIRWGCGPFVAVATSPEKALAGVGFGWMFGYKPNEQQKEGMSFALGAMLDSKVKNLAEGFRRNEAPPAGETTVRFEEKSRWSAILFVTRTF